MKSKILMALMMMSSGIILGQKAINKTYPVSQGQAIILHFDYPNLVRVTTWDKNEIQIGGSVSINGGENDDAFELTSSSSADRLSIGNVITNMAKLPHRITVTRNGQKTTYKSKEEYERARKTDGGGFDSRTEGLEMDITLDIKVPKGIKTRVESVYGMVEIKDFNGPLIVDATYGGVDAAVAERTTGELTASTNYGEIYSNLTTKFGGPQSREENFHTVVTAKPGTGPAYSFESKYGNVYLRKPVNP